MVSTHDGYHNLQAYSLSVVIGTLLGRAFSDRWCITTAHMGGISWFIIDEAIRKGHPAETWVRGRSLVCLWLHPESVIGPLLSTKMATCLNQTVTLLVRALTDMVQCQGQAENEALQS